MIVFVNHSTAKADPFAHIRWLVEERDAFGVYIREQAIEIVRLSNRLEGR